MSRLRTRRLTVVLVAGLLLSCGEESYDETGSPVADHLTRHYGLTFDGFELIHGFEVDEDGDTTAEYEVDVSLSGLDSRRMYVSELIFSAAEGGGVMLYVEELESGDGRYFFYSREENFVLFGQDLLPPGAEDILLRGAAVGRNEDGTYAVWTFDEESGRDGETEAVDGYAALRLVEQYNDFSTITPHVMLTAVAAGHTPVPESREIDANLYDIGNPPPSMKPGARGQAASPPVCTLFAEFCECAACSVLKARGGNCDLCPELSE